MMLRARAPNVISESGGPAPRRNKNFYTSNSIFSITRSVAYRDFDYMGVPYRIIDTPGLQVCLSLCPYHLSPMPPNR